MKTPSLKSPAFKSLILLALGLLALAFAQPAFAADVPWSATAGSPKIPVNKIVGFFIWHVKNEVYVTTANNVKKGDLFFGNLTVTGGNISGLTGTQLEKNDHLSKSGPSSVTFTFHTYTGHDGLHFKLTGGTTLSFDVTENGFPAPTIVFYGSKKTPYTSSADPIIFDLSK